MKKRKEEVPIAYFERSYVVLALFLVITGVLVYLSFTYILNANPWGILLALPAAILVFQGLWLILNPYAIIYKDKFEIKKSFISAKMWYFLDLKHVGESTRKGFVITYNDGDGENISDSGIRLSHKKKFRDAVNHYVCKSFVERDD